jgi:hypothetical protein
MALLRDIGVTVALFIITGLLIFLTSCGGGGPIPPADGQTVVDHLVWVNPSTRTDGSALTNLAKVRFQWGTSAAGPFTLGQVEVATTVAGANMTRDITRAVNVGTICYIGVAIDANGVTSDPSNVVCKTVVAPPSTFSLGVS